MNSSRSIATLLVMLIAVGCLVGIPPAKAEGPFDVDNSTNPANRGSGTLVVQPDDHGIGSDGNTAVLRSATGIIGGDWFTGIVSRLALKLFYAKQLEQQQGPSKTKSPAVDGARASSRL